VLGTLGYNDVKDLSQSEQGLKIWEYILGTYKYDRDYKGPPGLAGSLDGAMGDRLVCDGGVKVMKEAFDKLGIENYMICNPAANHIWILAKLDGVWGEINPTPNSNPSQQAVDAERDFFHVQLLNNTDSNTGKLFMVNPDNPPFNAALSPSMRITDDGVPYPWVGIVPATPRETAIQLFDRLGYDYFGKDAKAKVNVVNIGPSGR
jgi:hypothetical protein